MKHLLKILSQAQQKETVGKEDNPEIIKYFTALEFSGDWLHDETSWCAAIVNWTLKECGLPYLKALNARALLVMPALYPDKFELVMPRKPKMGDIAIYWRGSHPDELIPGSNLKKGHVGFYIRDDGTYDFVLGGNQGNTVKVSGYYKSRNLAYIRIKYSV